MRILMLWILYGIILITETCFSAVTFGDYYGEYNHLVPDKSYPYWPKYQPVPLKDVRAQAWRSSEDTIEGWDWSLPPDVMPANKGVIGVQRYIGLNQAKKINKIAPSFKVNALTILWVYWREIEVKEGVFDWEPLREAVLKAKQQGSRSVIRIHAHLKERHPGGEGHSPAFLKEKGIATITYKDHQNKNNRTRVNYDPSDPVFHKYYLRLVTAFGESGIPQMDEVAAVYAGYASPSFGDEGIGPHGMDWKNEPKHVIERLNAWKQACQGIESKVFMGGRSKHGLELGFGLRRGFIERYLYNYQNDAIGQCVDDRGYLYVDENAPVIRTHAFNGDVNEEYEEAWATDARSYRFGKNTDSFSYRYFNANLRALQMRCTYLHNMDTLMPELLAWVALELGRTAEDSPDIWCYLRESRIQKGKKNPLYNRIIQSVPKSERKYGIPLKNFERWLYQRDPIGAKAPKGNIKRQRLEQALKNRKSVVVDSEDYTTKPAVKMIPPDNMWFFHKKYYYEYTARCGENFGFAIDDRFLPEKPSPVAIKVSYFDLKKGKLALIYKSHNGVAFKTIPLAGDEKLKTSTFFINDFVADAKNFDYDLVIKASDEAVISFVRIIKVPSY